MKCRLVEVPEVDDVLFLRLMAKIEPVVRTKFGWLVETRHGLSHSNSQGKALSARTQALLSAQSELLQADIGAVHKLIGRLRGDARGTAFDRPVPATGDPTDRGRSGRPVCGVAGEPRARKGIGHGRWEHRRSGRIRLPTAPSSFLSGRGRTARMIARAIGTLTNAIRTRVNTEGLLFGRVMR